MYNNNTLGALDRICPAAEQATLGTIIDLLYSDVSSDTTYSGELLTEGQVYKLDNMCPAAGAVELGTVVYGLCRASKDDTVATRITDAQANLINKMCLGAEAANLGTLLQTCADLINNEVLLVGTDITTFTVVGQGAETVINEENHVVFVDMPYGTDLTSLVGRFTLSTGATATIGEDAQVSGTTENDFTNPVTYTITSGNLDNTQDWVVTIANLPSEENDILTFSVPAQTSVVIDDVDHEVNIHVPFATAVDALVATFTLSEGASAKVGATAQVSGVTDNDFTSPVTYTVTADYAESVQDWVVIVTVDAE